MNNKKYKNLIIDVDGVMTDGKFYYSHDGKVMKAFGADDHDALSILKNYINIIFVTGDKKGFKISKKRITSHMGFPLYLVSTVQRVEWIQKRFELNKSIYIGDGFFDYLVMQKVGYSLTPNNSANFTKKKSKPCFKEIRWRQSYSGSLFIYIKKIF